MPRVLTGAAPLAPIADLPPGVHLCNRLESTPKPHSRLMLATILIAVAFMTIIGMMSNRGGVVLFGLPVPPPIAVLLPLGTLGTYVFIVWQRHHHGKAHDPELSPGPSPEARVNIALHPSQRAALLPLRDEAFEPEIVTVFMPARSSVLHGNTWSEAFAPGACSLGILAAFILICLTLGPMPNVLLSPLGFVLLAIVCYAAWCFRRPMHVRVVPGRVDFMHAGLLGFGKLQTESFSLRDHPIRLDLRSRRLEIDRSPRASHVIEIWAALSPKSSQAAMIAIARAAVSTAEPGDLPTDQLTG